MGVRGEQGTWVSGWARHVNVPQARRPSRAGCSLEQGSQGAGKDPLGVGEPPPDPEETIPRVSPTVTEKPFCLAAPEVLTAPGPP